MNRPSHKWTFRARFRARAFGWRASTLAVQRLKEAVSEIKAIHRKEPVTAAEGAVVLMEKLWPALEHVDSSSGALGNAVNKTVHELVDILAAAPADEALRERWLERLWVAMEEDGVDYLWEVSDRWDELCGTPERASRAADDLLPTVRLSWSRSFGGYFFGTPACLSCLVAAGRYQEVLDLVETAPYRSWHHRRFGVRALAAMGRTDEAIRYAEADPGLNDSPVAVARTCEDLLLADGRDDEAYRRYALAANAAGTHLATFRAIRRKYPSKDPMEILGDLIASTPGEEGKWFATAKTLGFFELAAQLARRSPVAIGTLIRAARDHIGERPEFALEAATAALRWMARGSYYEISALDVWRAMDYALQAATALGRAEAAQEAIRALAAGADTDPFVGEQMQRRLRLPFA